MTNRLSTTDERVAELVLHGLSNDELATTLSLSPHTIRHALRRAREFHGARTTRELVARVLTARLVAAEARVKELERTLAVLDRRRSSGA